MRNAAEFDSAGVRGFLHRADGPHGLVLAHGAGSDCRSPLLVAAAHAFADAGFSVLRCDLPFRQARPKGPPGPGDASRDRAGLASAARELRALLPGRVFLGGHSYGGRQATMLAAEQPDSAAGLLLLSYPLHPPRQPDQRRTSHFPGLGTPALFVHGLRDPFGSPEEMRTALALLPGPSELLLLPGGHHLPGFGAASPLVIATFCALMSL